MLERPKWGSHLVVHMHPVSPIFAPVVIRCGVIGLVVPVETKSVRRGRAKLAVLCKDQVLSGCYGLPTHSESRAVGASGMHKLDCPQVHDTRRASLKKRRGNGVTCLRPSRNKTLRSY